MRAKDGGYLTLITAPCFCFCGWFLPIESVPEGEGDPPKIKMHNSLSPI